MREVISTLAFRAAFSKIGNKKANSQNDDEHEASKKAVTSFMP